MSQLPRAAAEARLGQQAELMRQPVRQPEVAAAQLKTQRKRVGRVDGLNVRQQAASARILSDALKLLDQLRRLNQLAAVPEQLRAQP
ncbi:hypothetical protein EIO60_01507|nr:hypothetical protein [Candidatus Pantoea persica]